jgi:hypothetical protein
MVHTLTTVDTIDCITCQVWPDAPDGAIGPGNDDTRAHHAAATAEHGLAVS